MENLGELYTQIYNIVKKSNIYIHKFTNDTPEDICHELTLNIIEKIKYYDKSHNFYYFIKNFTRYKQKDMRVSFNSKNNYYIDEIVDDNTNWLYFNWWKYYRINSYEDTININFDDIESDDYENNYSNYNIPYSDEKSIIQEIMNYWKENNIFTNEDFEYIKDCLILENKKPTYNSLTHKKIKRIYNIIKKKIYD